MQEDEQVSAKLYSLGWTRPDTQNDHVVARHIRSIGIIWKSGMNGERYDFPKKQECGKSMKLIVNLQLRSQTLSNEHMAYDEHATKSHNAWIEGLTVVLESLKRIGIDWKAGINGETQQSEAQVGFPQGPWSTVGRKEWEEIHPEYVRARRPTLGSGLCDLFEGLEICDNWKSLECVTIRRTFMKTRPFQSDLHWTSYDFQFK